MADAQTRDAQRVCLGLTWVRTFGLPGAGFGRRRDANIAGTQHQTLAVCDDKPRVPARCATLPRRTDRVRRQPAADNQLADTEFEFHNVALRGVEKAALRAGLGKVTPHDLRRSFCSLAGRRGVDPVEAAQITGHSPAVWARFYARSFGRAQRDEARDRLLEHGFGALSEDEPLGPLAPRSHGASSQADSISGAEPQAGETPANEKVPDDGAYRDRTGDLRLANPFDFPTPPDTDRQNRHE